jgi:hypothetical protein
MYICFTTLLHIHLILLWSTVNQSMYRHCFPLIIITFNSVEPIIIQLHVISIIWMKAKKNMPQALWIQTGANSTLEHNWIIAQDIHGTSTEPRTESFLVVTDVPWRNPSSIVPIHWGDTLTGPDIYSYESMENFTWSVWFGPSNISTHQAVTVQTYLEASRGGGYSPGRFGARLFLLSAIRGERSTAHIQ